MPRTLSVLTALVSAALSSPSLADQLVWKFEPGQVFRYQVVQETANDMTAGPAGNIKTATSQTVDMTWTVEKVNEDGSARLKHAVERVQMKMDAPMNQGFAFDTASPEPPEGVASMLAPAFNALVENGYSVTMSPAGELSDIRAPEDLLDAVKRLPGAGAGGSPTDSLKAIALAIAVPLPAEAPEQGAEWKQASGEVTAPMFGKMQVETTYRYDGPQEADGKTLAALSPTITVNATAPEGGPMTGTVKSKATTGQILFNPEAGRVESSKVEHTMDISLTVGEQTITGTIVQTSTVKFGVKSEAAEEAAETEAEPATAE